MSDKIFKPVADVFALIHAGGEPCQWTQDALLAAEWLRDNPNFSVKEFVSLDRYQAAVTDDLSALQQKLDAVLAENVGLKKFILDECYVNRCGVFEEPEEHYFDVTVTDAILNAVRAEGVEMLRGSIADIESGIEDTRDLYHYCTDFAAQLRTGNAEGGV